MSNDIDRKPASWSIYCGDEKQRIILEWPYLRNETLVYQQLSLHQLRHVIPRNDSQPEAHTWLHAFNIQRIKSLLRVSTKRATALRANTVVLVIFATRVKKRKA